MRVLFRVVYWANFKTRVSEKVLALRVLMGTPTCLSFSIVRSNRTTTGSLEEQKTAAAQGQTSGECNANLRQGRTSQMELLEAEVALFFISTCTQHTGGTMRQKYNFLHSRGDCKEASCYIFRTCSGKEKPNRCFFPLPTSFLSLKLIWSAATDSEEVWFENVAGPVNISRRRFEILVIGVTRL